MNSNIEKITVHYPNGSYPLYIGAGLLQNPLLLRQHVKGKQVLIVTNECVAPLYLQIVQAAFSDLQCDAVILPDGEQYKTLTYFEKIIDGLAQHKHHRDTTVIALGGGVVGDMTGFAAACYQRGVHFIQLPTTLLAQVDSSIGGKTAVNHPYGKNLIGAFYQPQAVIIDTDTLRTLPDREFYSGIAEIIKAAIMIDADFFDYLEKHMDQFIRRDNTVVIHAIKRACEIKANIIGQDEKEQGIRALCNLGHTFGHAIEHNLGYGTWLHGEAVGVGIRMAAQLSYQIKWLSQKDLSRIEKLLTHANLPETLPAGMQWEDIYDAMLSDKKILNAQMRLILIKAIGNSVITSEVSLDILKTFVKNYLQS